MKEKFTTPPQEENSPLKNNWILGEDTRDFGLRFPESDFFKHPEYFVPAKMLDYATWLKGYLLNGGEVYKFLDEGWAEYLVQNTVYATEDFVLDREYGSFSKSIIVLPGVKPTGDFGTNRLYFLDDYTNIMGQEFAYTTPEFTDFSELLAPSLIKCFTRDIAAELRGDYNYDPYKEAVETQYRRIAEKLNIPLIDKDIAEVYKKAYLKTRQYPAFK